MKYFLQTFTLLILSSSLHAQEKEYMYEIGGGIGTSWGYGDINRSSALYDPSLAADLLFRYNINLRWALAVDASTNGLKGDSKDFENAFPNSTQWSFDRRYWQLGIRPEFSFWNYGWGNDYREKHRVAPFLTAGLGVGISTGDTQQDALVDSDANTAFSIPLGLGVKWKMAPRWDLQCTALWTKSFGDKVDGIADPYNVGTIAPVNTDWIGSIYVSVTFCFKERCLECKNQNSF